MRHIRRRGACGSIARRLSTACSSPRCGRGDVRSARSSLPAWTAVSWTRRSSSSSRTSSATSSRSGIENVQLLEEILRQRRLLEDTFNSLVDLVVVTDRDMRIVQVNDAFASRVGVARHETIGRPLRELVGEETALVGRDCGSDRGRLPEGTRPIEDARLGGTFLLTATPLINQDAQTIGRVLVARDITRQTRLEREREGLRARLAQSEKLASLGQFVAGIAHEMNNPLARRARAPGAADRHVGVGSARPARTAADLSGRRSRREDRPEPARFHRLASDGPPPDAARSRGDAHAGEPQSTRSRGSGIEIHRTQGKEPAAGAGRSAAAAPGAAQHPDQRRARARGSGTAQSRGSTSRPTRTPHESACASIIRDTGPGIAPETLPMRVRSVLHHQGSRPGHRARPRDHLRHRPGARRHHHRRATPPTAARCSPWTFRPPKWW